MVFQCCVGGCKTVAKNGLHSFPANKDLAVKWILAIKNVGLMDILKENKLSRSYRKVCKKHFLESDFQPNQDGKSQLMPNSVPSLFLPEESVESINVQSVIPLNPVKRLQKQPRQLPNAKACQVKVGAFTLRYEPVHDTNHIVENEDEWVDVDSINDIELHANTNNILREHVDRCNQEWRIMESKYLRQIRDLKSKVTSLQMQLKNNKLNDTTVTSYLRTELNEMSFEFVKMQMTNSKRSKHGRRYTIKQKSMCLAFYKQGPKLYRFLETGFILPTKRTLGRHSANLLFKSGVDFKILEAVKNVVKDLSENDKVCSISWDEVSLKEHLDYCNKRDIIEGFIQITDSHPKFATHALTFMVRGINVSFKQSVGYFYTNGLYSFELVELVKIMIEAVSTTGLNPKLSVCDQVNTNANTVNTLINPTSPPKNDGQLLTYSVNNRKMIHCYDPSHLIKTVRNNWEKKDLVHNITKRWRKGDTDMVDSTQTASWDHIFELYRLDKQSTQRLLPKLSDEHLAPDKLKMKVSLATQVLSNTCGSVMQNCIEANKLPTHFAGTVQILFFMNDIFDSMNGSEHQKGDTLKCAVDANSIHFPFWEYALSILPKMSFINKSDGKANNRSTVLKKLESTIRGYVEFSKFCHISDIPKVSIRNTSQDGLENFFGCVKSCNQAQKQTPREYRTAYATMIINNITGTNSLHSNCEQDTSTSVLGNIHEFILDCNDDPSKVDIDEMIAFDPNYDSESDREYYNVDPKTDSDELILFDPQFESKSLNYFENEAISRASSVICQKLIKFTLCIDCKNILETTESSLIQNCMNVLCGLNEIIPHLCSETSLKKKLLGNIESIKTDIMGCPDHDLVMTQKMKELSAEQTIASFCYDINSFLSGKKDALPLNHNHIQKLAFSQYDQKRKKKKVGKYSDIFNS